MALDVKKPVEKFLDQPSAGRMTVQYHPVSDVALTENPPRFSWLPVVDEDARYVVRVSTDANSDNVTYYDDIRYNFYTPNTAFAPGTYYWSYAEWSPATKDVDSQWSEVRQFTVEPGLPETPIPSREERYKKVSNDHPRLWLKQSDIESFRLALDKDKNHANWQKFYNDSVMVWMDREVMAEPAPYPNNTRTPPVWRQTYIDCQELLYAIRHLAVAGTVLKDQALIDRSKEWLLAGAKWDPDGTTSRTYTDEWAYRVNLALAWGYDWLYNELTDDERKLVRTSLLARTRQVAEHAIDNAKIHLFPYDSHAVRSVSAVIIPACIAMLDEEPEASEWLDYSIEFLATLYSPWGDSDGGWAEGPHYWMTGIAYLIDAANLLRNYMDIDLYQRPFLQKTADFPFYTKPPNTRRTTFGDDSTMGDLPCLKVAYNVRQFAPITGKGEYQWYFDQIVNADPGTEMASYNYGWWDLNFDDMMYQHDFDTVEAVLPVNTDGLRWFKGVGWVAMHANMHDPDEHIQLILKSSPFGSISHSHGDQNAFVLSAFGEDLAIQSGYYVAFNSSMHRLWRRQTRSKNALLIGGKGQYADNDKQLAARATGRIIDAAEHDDHLYVCADATEAYACINDKVELVQREMYLVHKQYIVIVDSVDLKEADTVDWLLHTSKSMELSSKSFRYQGDKAGFYGQFIWSESGAPEITQIEGFPEVDKSEIEGCDDHYHLRATFSASKRHRIASLLVPYPIDQPRRIFHFVDDQGYDCGLYFTDSEERTFKVNIQKLAKA